MGLGPSILCLYKFMLDQGLFRDLDSVVEIGSQEYDMKQPEFDPVFERFCGQLGAEVPAGRDPESGRYKGAAGDFYRLFCSRYGSLDIDGRFGSRAFDLNYDTIGDELRHSAGLTTNLGTTEHVFNQLNCFRTIHELTRPGGLMLHAVPMNNYVNHGLFSYSPTFFDSLAEANGYEVLGLWVTAKPFFNLLPVARPRFPASRSSVVALLRRSGEGDFAMPLQLSNPMLVHSSMEARYVTTERHEREGTAKAMRYDGAVYLDLDSLESRLLAEDDPLYASMHKAMTRRSGGGKTGKAKRTDAAKEGAAGGAGKPSVTDKAAAKSRPDGKADAAEPRSDAAAEKGKKKAEVPKPRSLLSRLLGSPS